MRVLTRIQRRVLVEPGLRHFQREGEPHPIYVDEDGTVIGLGDARESEVEPDGFDAD